MSRSRLFFVALSLVGVTGRALASYEFLLAVEFDHINRYDPISGAYLGNFGQSQLGSYTGATLSLDPTQRGQVAVLNHDGGIRTFDYSTGIMTRSVSIGVGFYGNSPLSLRVLSNGQYVVSGYYGDVLHADSRIYNQDGTLATSLLYQSSYPVLDAQVASNGHIYTLNKSAGNAYYVFDYSGAGSYQGYTYVGPSTSADTWGHIGSVGGTMVVSGNTNATGPNFMKAPLGAGQTFVGAGSGSWLGTTGWTNLVTGHASNVHTIQSYLNNGSYTNLWYSYDTVNNNFNYRPLSTSVYQLGSIALVVAPEPGTYLALGLGALALMRRKRRPKA